MAEEEGKNDDTSNEDLLYPEGEGNQSDDGTNDDQGDGSGDDTVEYQLDDDGNQILDDDGNPIPVEASSYEDFEYPEGVEVDKEFLSQATEIMQADGLSQEQAQKYVTAFAEYQKQQVDGHAELVNSWRTESETDSEYGQNQDEFNASMGIAFKALETFGDDSLLEMLDQTGIGNHPAMVKFAWKVGQTLQEDNPNAGQMGGQHKELSREEILYPNS